MKRQKKFYAWGYADEDLTPDEIKPWEAGIAQRYGLSGFDVRRVFYSNFVYELPGAKWNGAAGKKPRNFGLSLAASWSSLDGDQKLSCEPSD